ncbi:MAG: PSD1 and planctomycete cytochrome C domain-containing protein [Terriglobia bacterium]
MPPAATSQIDFRRDIEPLLKEKCQSCHGPAQQMGGLRLDSRAGLLAGGNSGVVVKAGESADSRLILLVAGFVKELQMPMGGEPLTSDQVGLLRAWIDQGALWPEEAAPAKAVSSSANPPAKLKHWAFIPPQRPKTPRVKNAAWVRNPVDQFILARLEKEGIRPSAEADQETLIRRLSLDLIGLPPTPEEVAVFVADKRPDAYERLVDRLLDSPHYGEKWARPWLDLARYADSDGYEEDRIRRNAWRWRHWVIESINRNMPFDQFTIEQLAGDLLANASLEQRVATGFNRNTLTNREGGVNREEFRVEQVVDRTATVGTVWLGLTLGCARCHDHKYDPISQKEFYQLYAFFNTATEVNFEAPLPVERGPFLLKQSEYEKKRAALLEEFKVAELQVEWERKLREALAHPGVDLASDYQLNLVQVKTDGGEEILKLNPEQRTPKQKRILTDQFVGSSRFNELNGRLHALAEEYPALTEAPGLAENPHPPQTHILIRGNFQQPGIEVKPGTPAILPPLSSETPPTRLTLARWLVSKENPLTSRVTVNRTWQELFGRGLLDPPQDFGLRSSPPSHPELLDWLATEFVSTGWDVKKLHKLLVMSATYRQSSDTRKDLETRDPDNKLLARQTRLRLPAELVRDVTLSASGLLNPEVGGKSVRPPQPGGSAGMTSLSPWKVSEGPDRYRRGLYILFQRRYPYPQLITFDAPSSLNSCPRRDRSTTPLQALTLLNDPVFYEAAQALAVRLIQEKPGDATGRIEYAYQLCLARSPRPAEKERLMEYLRQRREMLKQKPESVDKLFPTKSLEGIDPFEGALWLGVSRVLLNLDEFITRG